MPQFAEQAGEAREAAKRERLAEACERALARRDPPRSRARLRGAAAVGAAPRAA